jgi:hypothetical protein
MIEKLSAPFWLPCQYQGRRRGQLQVQVQFVQDVCARPLRLLLVTWNLGNSPPCQNFPHCFHEDVECAPHLR